MSVKTAATNFILLMGLLALLPFAASAQITINSNDILGLIGRSQLFDSDTTTSITINVGAAGANQTWDFRSVVLRARKFTYQFVAPAGTPFAASFPQANFVQKGTLPLQPSSEFYSYLRVNPATLQSLGSAAKTRDTTVVRKTNTSSPLPVQFGTTWNTVQSDTVGQPPVFIIVTRITSSNTVDAWGRVRLPIGDFDCLRIRNNGKTVSRTINNGVVIFADSSTNIGYTWVTKNNFAAAQATSQKNETNPAFTNASNFGRLASTTTGVVSRDEKALPTGFELAQNFPNPFSANGTFGNPETKVAFQLSQPAPVELSIFTLTGEKVRTLIATPLTAGSHAAVWDGKDQSGNNLASGVYLYRLQIGAAQQTRRMILVR